MQQNDLHQDKALSSLHLIGGVDCDPTFIRKPCDLRIEGGLLVKKTTAVLGNVHIGTGSFLYGQMCGDLFTNHIQEKEPGEGIVIIGNVNVSEINVSELSAYILTANIIDGQYIQSDVVCSGNVQTNVIETKNGNVTLDMTNSTISLSAGPIVEYLELIVNGVPRKIALYDL